MPATAGTASGRADARDHPSLDPGVGAGQQLLSATAEDERVPALEPDDVAAGLRVLDEQPVDLVLVGGTTARHLGDVDDLGVRPSPRQRGLRGTRRSVRMTSAAAIASRPATVTRPGSPGPPPTSVTTPMRSPTRGSVEVMGHPPSVRSTASSLRVVSGRRTAMRTQVASRPGNVSARRTA